MTTHKDRILVLFFLAAVPILLGVLSVRLGQDVNFDLLNYHFYIAYAQLNNRINFDLAPAGFQTYLSPYLDVAYYFAVTHWKPKFVGFVFGVLQGLNFVVLYGICAAVLRDSPFATKKAWAPLFLAACGVLSVGFLSEVGRTFYDSLLALFPLLSLWVILHAMPRLAGNGKFLGALILAGFFAGLGSGFKLTNGIFALALCLSLLIVPVRWFNRVKYVIVFGVAVAMGLLVSDGYWLYKMWHLFGNPLFPAANHLFHGTLAGSDKMMDSTFSPRTLLEKMAYPIIFTLDPLRVGEVEYRQVSWLIAYAALVMYLLSWPFYFFRKSTCQRGTTVESSFLLMYVVLAYLIWQTTFGVYRYLIPIEILLPLVILILLGRIFSETRLVTIGAFILIGGITLFNLKGIPEWGRSPWSDRITSIDSQQITKRNPSAIFLAGYPLAWIVPALDAKIPFVQIHMNFAVSEDYWRRAHKILEEHEGRFSVILDSEKQYSIDWANEGLANFGLVTDVGTCEALEVYVAKHLITYRICDVKWRS